MVCPQPRSVQPSEAGDVVEVAEAGGRDHVVAEQSAHAAKLPQERIDGFAWLLRHHDGWLAAVTETQLADSALEGCELREVWGQTPL